MWHTFCQLCDTHCKAFVNCVTHFIRPFVNCVTHLLSTVWDTFCQLCDTHCKAFCQLCDTHAACVSVLAGMFDAKEASTARIPPHWGSGLILYLSDCCVHVGHRYCELCAVWPPCRAQREWRRRRKRERQKELKKRKRKPLLMGMLTTPPHNHHRYMIEWDYWHTGTIYVNYTIIGCCLWPHTSYMHRVM